MSKVIFLLALSLLFFSYGIEANSASSLKLSELTSRTNIDQHLEFLGEYSAPEQPPMLDDLLDTQAAPLYTTSSNITKTPASKWYRISLLAGQSNDSNWLLTTTLTQAPLLRVYAVADNSIIKIIDTSIESDFTQRPVDYRIISAPLTIQKEKNTTLFIQYQGVAKLPFTASIISESDFNKRIQLFEMMNGIALGATGVLFLFFFSQFLITKNSAVGIYAMMVLSVAAFIAQITGYTFQYLWPNSGPFNFRFSSVIAASTYFWYFLFTIKFFDISSKLPLLYKALQTSTSLMAVMIALGFFVDISSALVMVAIVSLPLPVLVANRFFSSQNPFSIFFLLGSVLHCTSALLFSLYIIGIDLDLKQNIFTIICIGQLVDIILFAAALIYRSKQVQTELNDHLQQKVNDAEKIATLELEKSKSLTKLQDVSLQLGAIAHDLTQPVSAIKMALSVIDRQESNQAKTRVEKAVEYTECMLHSIMNISKKNYVEAVQSCDISDILAGLHQRHEGSFSKKGLELRTRSIPQTLNCSPIILNRVLDNLLSNACRYTDNGGAMVTFRKRSDNTLLEVWDTGIGMHTQALKQSTQAFTRVTPDLNTQGHGLGLYIVHTLCQHSGFELEILSTPGRGSHFKVNIPQ